MKKLIFNLLLLFNATIAFSQLDYEQNKIRTNFPELTEEDLRAFQELTRQKMVEFQNELSDVPNRNKSLIERRNAIDLIKKKFYDANKNLIEVSSLRTKKINTYTISQYLENLFQLGNDKDVEIEFYEKSKITDFQKVAPGKYEATAVYYQLFNKVDRTEKKVEIKLTYTKDPFGENAYLVYLGNIKVISTTDATQQNKK